MKRLMAVGLTAILVAFSIFNLWGDAAWREPPSAEEPEVIIVGPAFQTFNITATQWSFFVTAVGFGALPREARLLELRVNGIDVMPVAQIPPILPIHSLTGEINRSIFAKWKELYRQADALRVHPFSKEEEQEFRDLSMEVRRVTQRRRDVKPVWFQLKTSELPFKPVVGQTYTIDLAVQASSVSSSFQSSVLIVNVPENPNWFPADLHIHSVYSDGTQTPNQLAAELANKHYRIGYVTDEPDGDKSPESVIDPRMSDPDGTFPQKPTWEQYRNAVTNASTTSIVMLPGLEVAASTLEMARGEHYGHALAYGIRNLTGTQSFGTTGLRYRWFLPNTLLNNINANASGVSSGSIAHPTNISFAWLVWGSLLTARYDGIELMSGVQLSYHLNSGPMTRWRSELSHRLSGVFNGQGFPSARTGSDFCGKWYSPSIKYYTFLRLPSTPSSWTYSTSLQNDVDAALRLGRTVASRLGGLATFTLNGWQIGDWFTHSSGSNVNGNVHFRPALSGIYRVTVYEDNLSRIVYQSPFTYVAAGASTNHPFSFTFPGGMRFYHVYVEDGDGFEYIYTSPIFIRQPGM